MTPATTSIHPAGREDVIDDFDGIASRYDLLTRLNPGYVKHLRWSAERVKAPPGARLLDLCCGTGLSTAALLATYPDAASITGLDASRGMLDFAAAKVVSPRGRPALDFVLGDATDPSAVGVTGPFDGVLMAYGIRNVPDADLTLTNLFELLAPGARVVFHEYSVADSKRAALIWDAVCLSVITPLGAVATGNRRMWSYLRSSVHRFDGVRDFEARLARHGFVDIETLPMDGWQRGIVHSFVARRPR